MTRYLDKTFLKHLSRPQTLLEYKQVNLLNKENHLDIFTPPKSWNGADLKGKGDGDGFDVVFDLTGETSAEKPEIVNHTLETAYIRSKSKIPIPSRIHSLHLF
jgi:hypothetical protein